MWCDERLRSGFRVDVKPSVQSRRSTGNLATPMNRHAIVHHAKTPTAFHRPDEPEIRRQQRREDAAMIS